ncbi:Peptide transporter 3 [Aphelenchoides bicaudatus]|nr:Peptide transporter 3 [Aphelenchoides bicaudatus]
MEPKSSPHLQVAPHQIRHKNSIFSMREDDSPSRHFNPAAEPLLLVDSGVPVIRRGSSCPSHASNLSATTPPPPDNNNTMGAEEMQKPKGLLRSLRNYPTSVFFILGNEFCERFSFYGMRSILVLYLINEHNFKDSTASLFYHAFVSLAYFSPLFGSIAADNYFGRFRVILWVSLVYVAGHALLSVGAIPYLDYTLRSIFDFGGLIVIALATGGIKPCVSAFAADQFREDQQEERSQFFSFFYFSINAGSLVAILLTPLLRGRVRCFGSEYCFPLAFGVPGVLMLFAFLLFLAGIRFYKVSPAGKGNVIWKVFKCIAYAVRGKLNAKLKGQDSASHWLDYASPKYSDGLINGVKSLVAVGILFIPVTFFWALLDQQGSTWVLQARRMDGRIGPITILPDQMTLANPLIILIMVPVFEAFLYPLARKLFVVTPLRKMAFGGVLAALAFVMAGLLQLKVNESMEPIPSVDRAFLYRIGNSSADLQTQDDYMLKPGKNEWPANEYDLIGPDNEHFNLSIDSASAYVVGVFQKSQGDGVLVSAFKYSPEKSGNGRTRLYLLVDPTSSLIGEQLFVLDHNNEINAATTIRQGASIDIQPALISSPDYLIVYGVGCSTKRIDCTFKRQQDALVTKLKNCFRPFFAQMGAAHVINLSVDSRFESTTLVRPNSVHIMWQLPQFIVITLGEILFSVTGLEFSYSQAAPTMKSVLQALWLMTTFFGNMIDMAISGTHIISEPALEFFFYSALMFLIIGIFVFFALNYTYVDEDDLEDSMVDFADKNLEKPKEQRAVVAPPLTNEKKQ